MIKLTTIKGQISVPTGMHEISLSAYHDFLAVLRRSGLLKKDSDEEDENSKRDVSLLSFVDYLLEALNHVCEGDLTSLPVGSLDDNITETASLFGVFSHMIDLITNFKPIRRIVPEVGYFFEYKGETFEITPERASSYVTGIAYTTAEAIEVLEMDRLFAMKIAQTSDPEGVFSFEMDLRRLAVLARKDGEELPMDKLSREHWINKRAEFMQDVTADVALEVRFFFIGTLMLLVRDETRLAHSRA